MEELRIEERINSEIESDEDFNKYLTFEQGNEVYGIIVSNVKEVINYTNVTRVPRAPEYIRGVINIRGDVVPLIDLSFLFYGIRNEITALTCVVIVMVEHEDSQVMLGLMIDAINAVTDIASKDIELPPEFGAKIPSEYIVGVGKVNNRFVILLDINKMLDISKLSKFMEIENCSE